MFHRPNERAAEPCSDGNENVHEPATIGCDGVTGILPLSAVQGIELLKAQRSLKSSGRSDLGRIESVQ